LAGPDRGVAAGAMPAASLRLGRAVLGAVIVALAAGTVIGGWQETNRYAADTRRVSPA
jgi:hypothetical protein